ncbi:hypothetical protein DL89DRAFT_269878, partial [Linderina pennispora]
HGYGPPADAHNKGESATYDNVATAEQHTAAGEYTGEYADEDGDRGFTDFFRKRPDPHLTAQYGEHYIPEYDNKKIAIAGVAALALLVGANKLHKKHQSKKEHRRKRQEPDQAHNYYRQTTEGEGVGNASYDTTTTKY